jgi:O-antigen/teichoic acid export membrane protein
MGRSTALNFADAVISLLSGVAVSVILARTLGPDRFGLYSLVITIVAFVYLVARFGINETVRRYAAELDGRGERRLVATVAGRGLRLGLASAAVAAVVMFAGAIPLAHFFKQDQLRSYLLLAAISLLPTMAAGILTNVVKGLQQYQFFLTVNLVTSPLWVIACAAVVWQGAGIAGLLIVGIGVDLLRIGAIGWWMRREVGISWRGRIPDSLRGRLARYNAALAVLMLLNAVVWQRSEIVFLGHFQGPSQVAYYTLPFGLTDRLTSLLPGALLGVLLPSLTYVQAASDPARFTATLSDALRYLAVLTLPITLFGIIAAPYVIHLLYGERFTPAVGVLQILLVAVIFGVLGQASSAALLSLEGQGWLLKTGAIAAAGSLVLDVLLIPRYGAIGAAVANTAAQAGWAVAAFVPLWRRVLPVARRAVSRIAAVALLIAALLAGAVVISPTLPMILIAGFAACVLYVVALDRLCLLTPEPLIRRVRTSI